MQEYLLYTFIISLRGFHEVPLPESTAGGAGGEGKKTHQNR